MNKINKILLCILNPHFYKAYMSGVAPLFELSPLLKKIDKIKTIIDIGSNDGNLLSNFNENWYRFGWYQN